MFEGVKRNYLYCMGESVLDKRKFSEDNAFVKATNRFNQESLDTLLRQGLRADLQQAQRATEQRPMLPAFLQPVARVLSQVFAAPTAMLTGLFRFVQAPVQSLLAMMPGAMGEMLQKAGAGMEKAMANVLSFFFGHKNERTEKEDKEKRDQNEVGMTDMFGSLKVEQASESGMGGGQG